MVDDLNLLKIIGTAELQERPIEEVGFVVSRYQIFMIGLL